MLPTDLFLVQLDEPLPGAAVALVAAPAWGDRVIVLAELSSWKMPP